MAVTVINLTDPVATLVSKTNIISADVGDITLLSTGDSNVVDAINATRALSKDSSDIITISRSGLSVDNTAAAGLSLGYNSFTGVISLSGGADAATVRSYLVAGAGLDYDSVTGVFSIGTGEVVTGMLQDSSITEAKLDAGAVSRIKLKDVVTLKIYDAAGSVVKTLYSVGS